MKKKNTNLWMLAAMFAASTSVASAQIQEGIGSGVTGTSDPISSWESGNDFDVDALTYSGTGDIRESNPSHATAGTVVGYTGATGAANVLIHAQQYFMIEVVNTNGCSVSDALVFGVHKSNNASNGSELKVQYESAPGVWTDLSWSALPTGTNTSGSGTSARWYQRSATLPSGALDITMRFRFFNSTVGPVGTNPYFQIDDIGLSCANPFDCSQVAPPVLTADGDSVYCEGGSVMITSTSIIDASYTFYQVINGVETIVQGPGTDIDYEVTESGTYYVVQSFNGCASSSNYIWLRQYEAPTVFISLSPSSPVAPSATVTATASLPNSTIFFSEYVEGTGFNKYIEIYNPTNTSVNMDNIAILAYHNGELITNTPTFTINLNGPLASGGTYVVAHTLATLWGGTANVVTGDLQFNGDDALVLVDTVTNKIYDIFGSVGNDPGSRWRAYFGDSLRGTENQGFIRKSCVYKGIETNPALPGTFGFPTLALEWDTTALNDVSDLGIHTFGIDYTWMGTNGSFVAGDNIGASVDFTVGQQGSSLLTAELTGLCSFNDCGEIGNQVEIIIGGARSMNVDQVNAPAVSITTYPNPFSNTVNIAVNAEADGMVKIDVIDMFGKVVAVVANTNLTAGQHNFVFDGSVLQTGAYTARVISATGMQTLRLVKAK